jgi:hypothetical protein
MNGDRHTTGRRAFLHGAVSIGALVSVNTATAAEGTIDFDAQASNGATLVVAGIETSIEALLVVDDADSEEELASFDLPAGTYEEYEIKLNQQLEDDTNVRLRLYPAEGGSRFARAEAMVFVGENIELIGGIDVTKVAADPAAGFEYPYYLYAPASPSSDAGGPLLIEPNNTGTATNDFAEHESAARKTANGEWNGGGGRYISEELLVPFLVPAFPRPSGDPVDASHYTHQLDRKTMAIDSGSLRRIDEQLLAMATDARQRLADCGYPVDDGLLLNGFSASGNFVNRFAALHPEEVTAVTAGGVNGMAVLPRETAKGEYLPYHVGSGDIGELTEAEFDADAYAEVDQFLYMGGLDFNDTVDAGDFDRTDPLESELLEYRVFGPNMQRDRFPYTKWAYQQAGIDGAVFRIYDEVTHNPKPAFSDLVAFHQRALTDGDTAALGGGVKADSDSGGAGAPPQAVASVDASEAPITLDAGDSSVYDDSLQAYAWTVTRDGETVETAAGEQAIITLAPGEYEVQVRVVDARGRIASASTQLTNGGSEPGSGAFTVSELEPTATTVAPGAAVTVTATITNAGRTADSTSVVATLNSDDVAGSETTLTGLDTGDSRTVELSLQAPETPGEYTHGIRTDDDEATGTLTVQSGDVPTDPQQRVLQITGRSSAEGITQNDVTTVITRFNRGETVNGIEITQNDVTTTVTLFGRR